MLAILNVVIVCADGRCVNLLPCNWLYSYEVGVIWPSSVTLWFSVYWLLLLPAALKSMSE